MESQAKTRRLRISWEVVAWVGTALMLVTYTMLSMRQLKPEAPFYACQLAGQIVLVIVSASKRAWQPAAANIAFAAASVVGLIYSFAPAG